jgi:hypothetical protein
MRRVDHRRIPRAPRARLCAGLCVALGAAAMMLCGCGSHATTSGSLPAGVLPGPSPGSYVVNCFVAQCTAQPQAGPFHTTCTTPTPSTDEQYCAASRLPPTRPATPSPVPTSS